MKKIFFSERDHYKWSKQKEYISHLETIDADTKSNAINAISFLEQEFGVHFLKTASVNHPVRQMILDKAPFQIKELIEFADTLQILKKGNNNYKRLIQKLHSEYESKIEGILLVDVARMFIKEGFVISFIDEEKNSKTPDVRVYDPTNQDTFYLEITTLNKSDNHKQTSENYMFFHNQFNNVQPLFSFYGKQLKPIDKNEYIEIGEIIADAKKKVKENNQIIYYSDCRFSFLLAPPIYDNDFNEVCRKNNIRSIHFQGLPINIDETSRINNKISKAYQIPEDKNGLLFVSVSPNYFMTTALLPAIERLEANIGKHKNLLGIILFSEIVSLKESIFLRMGNHCFSRKMIENLSRESLFIFNKDCTLKLSEETIKKIYKALS